MKELMLTGGNVAFVDDDIWDVVTQYKWQCENGYVSRNAWDGKRRRDVKVYLARFVMDVLGHGRNVIVDHIDHNPLNNTRDNLRVATRSQNAMNMRLRRDNVIGMKGVTRARNKFRARIRVDKKLVHIGYFRTPEEAHLAYCETALAMFGSFARFS